MDIEILTDINISMKSIAQSLKDLVLILDPPSHKPNNSMTPSQETAAVVKMMEDARRWAEQED